MWALAVMEISMQTKIIGILNKLVKKNIFFGPQGFSFPSSINELEKLNETFASDNEWASSWLVFSQDIELGDPYFVNTESELLPVYTAMYAEGGWEVEMVASSLDSFITCMGILDDQSNQEQAQIIPDDSTITNSLQLKEIERNLIANSAVENFWQMFFECYMDWLEDDDES
jgi:hypothetical protein